MKRTKLEMREVRKEEEKIRAEMSEVNRTQEEIWDAVAMNELRQRESNLKLRSVPETQGEKIKEKLTAEIAQWLNMEIEEVEKTIQNAFRIKIRTTKAKKSPGDCLIIFKDKEMRDLILQKKNREKRLNIDGNYIIIFKDVPVRLLKKRDRYRQLVQTLKKNGIEFKWEFPEGVIFTYKGKRHRLTKSEDVEKKFRRYRELTREGEVAEGAGARGDEGDSLELEQEEERSRKEKRRGRGEKKDEDEESEEDKEEKEK